MKCPWWRSRCQRRSFQAGKAKRPGTKLEERKRRAGRGRKVVGLENLPRLDAALFEEVDQENRDVLGLRACEVLVALDVLVCAMRGCWAALLATISATGLTASELADARLLNHHESEVVGIIEVVQDHGVGLGEGLSLRVL